MKFYKAVTAFAAILLASCSIVPINNELLQVENKAQIDHDLSIGELTRSALENYDKGEFAFSSAYFHALREKNGFKWTGHMLLKYAAVEDQMDNVLLADTLYNEYAIKYGYTIDYLNNLGFSHLLRGNLNEAERLFNRAKLIDPQNEIVKNNITLLLKLRGMLE